MQFLHRLFSFCDSGDVPHVMCRDNNNSNKWEMLSLSWSSDCLFWFTDFIVLLRPFLTHHLLIHWVAYPPPPLDGATGTLPDFETWQWSIINDQGSDSPRHQCLVSKSNGFTRKRCLWWLLNLRETRELRNAWFYSNSPTLCTDADEIIMHCSSCMVYF